MNQLYYKIKNLIPNFVLQAIRPVYHLSLAWLGSILYKNPSKEICVIAVTGTKGKSTTVEILSSILEASGKKVASLSTIQFKLNNEVRPNLYKMTTPGRMFVQKFLREAVDAGCTHAVIELTSEGARQYRHKFIELDGLIFTNLTPEHIESHGSFEKYKAAKLEIAKALATSSKRPRYMASNRDDEHGKDFLDAAKADNNLPYSLEDLKLHTLHKDGVALIFKVDGEEITIRVPLVGLFNVYNALAAITLARAIGVEWKAIERGLNSLNKVAGRVEHIHSPKGSDKKITAIVDYAHTPDSLEKLYQAFKDVHKVCVLGNTGGGRDKRKRPEMAKIAEKHCSKIVLTNEDPYDENPRTIVEEMANAITNKDNLEIVMDRRHAIRRAIELAPENGYVIISGKGTDPYIMGPNGTKTPWSDAEVVKEELAQINKNHI